MLRLLFRLLMAINDHGKGGEEGGEGQADMADERRASRDGGRLREGRADGTLSTRTHSCPLTPLPPSACFLVVHCLHCNMAYLSVVIFALIWQLFTLGSVQHAIGPSVWLAIQVRCATAAANNIAGTGRAKRIGRKAAETGGEARRHHLSLGNYIQEMHDAGLC